MFLEEAESRIRKALPGNSLKPKERPGALYLDPFMTQNMLGYRDKLYGMSYEALKIIPYQLSTIAAIVQTRIGQVIAFASPYRLTKSLGYMVRHKDPGHKLKLSEKKLILKLEAFMAKCGFGDNPYTDRTRPSFDHFLRMYTWDSLVLDQAVMEIVPSRAGYPFEFWPVDGSSMRIAAKTEDQWNYIRGGSFGVAHKNGKTEPIRSIRDFEKIFGKKKVDYLQVYQGMVVNAFDRSQIGFGVRNPTTDMRMAGYGVAEAEKLIRMITGAIYAETYNLKFFSNGTQARGIVNLKGYEMSEHSKEEIRRNFKAFAEGVHNAHRVMVFNAEGGLEWHPFDRSNQEMEFKAWLEYLLKIICFPAGTKITMADGRRISIEDIEPDDWVITHDGRTRPVNNIQIHKHTGKIICINAGGEIVRATPEHPFYISSSEIGSHMQRRFEEPEWVDAKNIVAGRDYLIVPKRNMIETVCEEKIIDFSDYVDGDIKEDKIRLKSNASNYVNRYLKIDKDVAYLLGLFASEGHATNYNMAFCFAAHETDYAQAVIDFANKNGLVCADVTQKESSLVKRIYSGVYSRCFRKMFGPKAICRKVPEEILQSPIEIQKSFLNGVIAGDGCIIRNKSKSISICIDSASECFINQIRWMLLGFGIYSHVYVRSSDNRRLIGGKEWKASECYNLRITGACVVKCKEWLTGEKGDRLLKYIEEIGEDRVKSKVGESPSYFYVPVSEVWEEDFNDDVYNLEVDDIHTYTANGFSVHNCAVYAIDPAEINFETKGGVSQTPLFEASQEWKLKASRDRGLKPLLKFLAGQFTQHIISKFHPDLVFEFVGLDELTEQEKHTLKLQQLQHYRTINEVRAEEGLDPIPGGDIVLHPSYIQALHQGGGAPAPMGATPPIPSEPEYQSLSQMVGNNSKINSMRPGNPYDAVLHQMSMLNPEDAEQMAERPEM